MNNWRTFALARTATESERRAADAVRLKQRKGPLMTVAQLAERLAVLENTIKALSAELKKAALRKRKWWVEDAGRFAGDPIFDGMVRLGREYRESLRPGRRKAKRDRP